jgi:hypothetical protein
MAQEVSQVLSQKSSVSHQLCAHMGAQHYFGAPIAWLAFI